MLAKIQNFYSNNKGKIAGSAAVAVALAQSMSARAADLFTAPDPANFITDASAWVTPLVTSLLVVAGIIVGVLVAGMFTSKLISVVIKATGKVTGHGKSGGRRRR